GAGPRARGRRAVPHPVAQAGRRDRPVDHLAGTADARALGRGAGVGPGGGRRAVPALPIDTFLTRGRLRCVGLGVTNREAARRSLRRMRPSPALTRDAGELVDALAEARERTLALVEPIPVEDLERVHSPLMSPLVWDLGHIAAFEALWLVPRFP